MSYRIGGVLIVLALTLFGCASHSDKTLEIRSALDAGQPKKALSLLNDQLDVKSEKDLPEDLGGDNSLLLLDRAMILQGLDQYQLSSRDLEVADKHIEILDLSRNAMHDIGKYLFSDDVGPYKAPSYEKLLINSLNMLNYLVRGDLNGARVEARRFAIMQKYISDHEDKGRSLLGPGSYLAGFTFEKSGRADEGLLYYDEALAYAQFRTLADPVRRLLARGGRGSPRLKAIAGEPADGARPAEPADGARPAEPADGARPAEPASAAPDAPAEPEDAEILVVVSFGRVPAKIAKRVPIGLALTFASGYISPHDASRANELAAQGLVTWINFPELGKPKGNLDIPRFILDGTAAPLDGALAVDLEAQRAWEDVKGPVMASAITRMVARIIAGQAVKQASKDDAVGTLLSLGLQASLTAADTPDTRNWSTLPARIAIGRMRVKPGEHTVDLVSRGIRKRQRLNLKPGGWAVVAHTVLF